MKKLKDVEMKQQMILLQGFVGEAEKVREIKDHSVDVDKRADTAD